MTAEKLQDAIGLLPTDLIAATDRLRTNPRTRVIQWKRWASLAACLVLLLSIGLVFRREILPGMGAKTEAAMKAPAAAAPKENQIAADNGEPETYVEEAAPEAPAEMADGITTEVPAAENGIHNHSYAQDRKEPEEVPSGYSGNLVTRVTVGEETYEIYGGDSGVMTDILGALSYDPDQICRCMAEFTVDTELLAGIEINLTEAFARCELGQAALTEEQVAVLREILENLR